MPDLANTLKKVPFLKFVIPLIAGIMLEIVFKAKTETCLIFLISSFVCFVIFSFLKIQKNFAFGYLWGISLTLLVFSLGIYVTQEHLDDLQNPSEFTSTNTVITEVSEIPVTSTRGLKVPVIITYFKSENKWIRCKEKCNLYIGTDNFKVTPGNILLIKTRPRPIDLPVSPYQFDFKTYLYYKGMCFNIYSNSKDILKLNIPERLSISLLSLKIRSYLLNKLAEGGINKKQNPVLSALLLGYTGNIDPDVRNSYAIAGVMHILSVSGMHVGIVYLFLIYLLFFMEKNKYLRILKTIIIICGLWFYALVTGFSPPVIRAATMFSFFAAGQALNRNSNQFNTLAASAFFMLLFNPLQITDMGFQLSYAALTGIFIFYKPLYELWSPSAYIIDKIWALIALSVSAQLGTLPLSLFYFHQFPTYFIITNIVIVPLTGLIIYTGLAFLVLSFWPFATMILATILNFLMNLLDISVSSVEYLPMSNISEIYLNIFEMLALTFMIFFIALWVKTFNKNLVFAFLSVLLVFTSSISFRHIMQDNQKVLIVHNAGNRTAVSIINGHKWLLIADSAVRTKIEFASSNMISRYGITEKHFLATGKTITDTLLLNSIIHSLANRNLLLVFQNKKILIANNLSKFNGFNKHVGIDYFIANTGREKNSNLEKMFASSVIIINNRTSEESTASIENKFHHKCFFVSEQGSFKEDL